MNKLRLELDALTVESFDPSPDPVGAGTVLGHDSYATAGVYCNTYCGACSTLQSANGPCGDTNYAACTYGKESCGVSCGPNCVSNMSCEGSCPAVGCPTGFTCDGSTCAASCAGSCAATCGCTNEVSCPCI